MSEVYKSGDPHDKTSITSEVFHSFDPTGIDMENNKFVIEDVDVAENKLDSY